MNGVLLRTKYISNSIRVPLTVLPFVRIVFAKIGLMTGLCPAKTSPPVRNKRQATSNNFSVMWRLSFHRKKQDCGLNSGDMNPKSANAPQIREIFRGAARFFRHREVAARNFAEVLAAGTSTILIAESNRTFS